MSAYVASHDTTVVAAYYAAKSRTMRSAPRVEEVQAAYNVLRAENYRSVNYRYGEDENCELGKVTSSEVFAAGELPVHVAYGCVKNLDYQSCEAPDYFETEAAQLLRCALDAVVRKAFAGKECGWGLDDGDLKARGRNVVSLA